MKIQIFLASFISLIFLNTSAQNSSNDEMTLAPAPVETSRNPAQSDREVVEKAKSKNYRGGGEEGELRVQPVLVKAQRKIAPAIDKAEADKENQEHD